MLKLLGSALILGAGAWLRWNTLAQQRRQRRDNTVERERQEIGEQKLQDRHRETYKIEFHKLPERASFPCGKALVQPLPCVHGETVTPIRWSRAAWR